MSNQAGNEFSYTSEPHAAPVKAKGKYRDENNPGDDPMNLMSDPRVVRGSTYAAKVTTQSDVAKMSKAPRRIHRWRELFAKLIRRTRGKEPLEPT